MPAKLMARAEILPVHLVFFLQKSSNLEDGGLTLSKGNCYN